MLFFMERIVDITNDGLHLAIKRGFLTVSKQGTEMGRVALDDIGALTTRAYGITFTNQVFIELAGRSVPIVLCGSNHSPIAMVWPVEGHFVQAVRMNAQASSSRPLQKQMWSEIIRCKIIQQGAVLIAHDKPGRIFQSLARQVRSGDPENKEAQAARKYWTVLFGKKFKRDTEEDGINGLLNYGYTVLRALVSRAICASGLHPTLGVFHRNRSNAFALADDLMEPCRPFVDHLVFQLFSQGKTKVDAEAKSYLASLATLDLKSHVGTSPVSQQIHYFVHSVAESFETGKVQLALPDIQSIACLENSIADQDQPQEEDDHDSLS